MNDYNTIPLNGLRHFLWAAKLESFKQAATKLYVTEAAVSQQIRKLESILGFPLFVRGHQKVTLTTKGEQLLPYIESAFNNIDQGLDKINHDPEPNRINLTTFPSLASNWLIGRLPKLNAKYPALSISMDTSLEKQSLDNRTYDLAIRYGVGNYAELKSQLLLVDPVVLVCSSSLVKSKQLTKKDIFRLPLIKTTYEGIDSIITTEFAKYYDFNDKQPNQALLIRDGGLGAEAARSGQGIAMQRLSLVADMIISGELVYATDYAFKDYNVYAVTTEEHFKQPKIIKFLQWINSEMQLTQKKIIPLIAKIKN
ncbi:LysR substrate-binding domain-containing protein [Aliikangiella sp. IMCC44359]|uniref:LysR substrate-binding domain-containing protein n=1 Tax=Aliikangiella sp. IMCC44359 TaxID=3459125 RepID=UPI00403AA2FD